jgi:hypothetical protein
LRDQAIFARDSFNPEDKSWAFNHPAGNFNACVALQEESLCGAYTPGPATQGSDGDVTVPGFNRKDKPAE